MEKNITKWSLWKKRRLIIKSIGNNHSFSQHVRIVPTEQINNNTSHEDIWLEENNPTSDTYNQSNDSNLNDHNTSGKLPLVISFIRIIFVITKLMKTKNHFVRRYLLGRWHIKLLAALQIESVLNEDSFVNVSPCESNQSNVSVFN